MNLKTIKIKIKGIRPMLHNNGMMADRLYPWKIKLAAIEKTKASKRTDAQWAEYEQLQWLGKLYWSESRKCIAMPVDNLHACLVAGARKAKQGKNFEAAVFFDDEHAAAEVKHALSGKTQSEMYADRDYVFRKPVVIGLAKVISIRPMIPTGWTISTTITYDDSVIANAETVVEAMVQAGSLCGLGDWRPRFGRFIVESWSEVK